MFRTGKPVPGLEHQSSLNRCGPSFFELHTGPVASGHDQRPDTRPIEAPSRKRRRKITLQNRGHPHTPRVCRRLVLASSLIMSSKTTVLPNNS